MHIGVALPAALAGFMGALLAWISGPDARLQALLAGIFVAVLFLVVYRRNLLIFLVILSWVFISVQHEWGRRLPSGLSGEDVIIQAQIVNVQAESGSSRLRLSIESCHSPEHLPSCSALRSVRVSAYDDQRYLLGERWQMTLRLRPPSGFSNPNTFNFQQWLWREGIHATGYVRQEPKPERLSEAAPTIRQSAIERLASQPLQEQTRRWLAALTLGDSEQLTQDDWTLLNATGTTHLVVISGLHVGLVASFVLLLARFIARLVTPTHWRLRAWPWWLAGVAAVGYAILAGLAPPAMRAMIMTLLGLWVLSGRHAPGPWQAWWLALGIVIVVDPLALWRPGLWLSFIAVAWLIVIWQGRPRPQGVKGWCWALLRSQLLIAPLMAAAVLVAFERVAPAAPLINLFAVPWVSSVMVPSALLGWVLSPLPGIGLFMWWCFEQALQVFHYLLVVTVHWAPLLQPPSMMVYPLVGILVLMSLCWAFPTVPGWLRFSVPLLLLSFPWWPADAQLNPGEVRVVIYDVGQGQLIELRSTNYRLLYDTGPRFRSGFMPLQTLWPPGQSFDRVIVSHADTDHAGGVSALLKDHQVTLWSTPRGESLPVASTQCVQGQQWRRDGIHYQILWPPAGDNALSSNDRSCVLQVSAGEQRLLITGDVGKDVERRVLAKVITPINVLVAGHHGSNTSSGIQFLQVSRPQHVIFSAGKDNPFNHPVDAVVRRFRQQQSCLWSTAQDGALEFSLMATQPIQVIPMRKLPGARKRC
ncbi:DNA internalization-related competence protein ComEC/Rec2 [Halomonas qinghailakensis]|uniref:DNA internalization-related competence protein ComEC/Rec2 n=1 Tax=Halomonas qinghailakensis TaxID=2937790 RepID=A0AA46TQ59_9GAMM|nr:DNA internalization-related competence protein ComEC/Rec2 [Halomonas sp. ZZQ-149]UYO74158.1 DNA internalization-related competence protein ComEC/Rec2 [Halomonas sp. ZZQ-149]